MKNSIKKGLIIGACVVAPVAVLSASTITYFSTPTTDRISTQGIYLERVNGPLITEGYYYDYSSTYGGFTQADPVKQLMMNEVIHLKTSGNFVYDEVNGKVLSPSYESYKFELGKSIVLTFVSKDALLNGNKLTANDLKNTNYINQAISQNSNDVFQLEFNSDDDEIEPTDPNGFQFIILKDSNNKRSINNRKVFWEIVKHGYLDSKINLDDPNLAISAPVSKNYVLVNMGFTFKDNVYWANSKGEKTEYKVVAKDMFYSIWRTYLYDFRNRRVCGGSKEIDNYFIKKYNVIQKLTEKKKYPNAYLFDFFGLDFYNDILDESRALKNFQRQNEATEDQMYTFWFNVYDKNSNLKNDFSYSIGDIFDKYFLSGTEFCLAPSQYIDKLNENASINKTPAGEIKNECKKYGIYTYATTRENTLFASRYIPVEIKEGRAIYEYNKYTGNQDWVASIEKGTTKGNSTFKGMRKIIYEYTNGIDDTTFKNQTFSSFLNGQTSVYDFSKLTDAQKQKLFGPGKTAQELIDYAKNKGVRSGKVLNKSSCLTRIVWASVVAPNSPIENYFNEEYAKVMFGGTIDQLKAGSVATASTFYAGNGLKFRSLIQAAVNWVFYIGNAFKDSRDVWLSGAAQDARFSSFKTDSLTPKEFFNYSEKDYDINNLKYYDANTNTWVPVLYSEMVKRSQLADSLIPSGQEVTDFKMKSPYFEEIKKSMKKFLDDLNIVNPIVWKIPFPYIALTPDTRTLATENIVKILQSIDSRIKPEFVRITEKSELYNHIVFHQAPYAFNGWGYDYEGIGSWLASFCSNSASTQLFSAFGIFSKDINTDPETLFQNNRLSKVEVDSLQKEFPYFTELAKYVRQRMNHMWSEANINVETPEFEKWNVKNWDLMTNSDFNELDNFFKNQSSVDVVAKIASIFKEFEGVAPWESSQSNVDNGKGWIKLIQEVNIIKGVAIDTDESVKKLSDVDFKLFLSEYIIPISRSGFTVMSDYMYEVKK